MMRASVWQYGMLFTNDESFSTVVCYVELFTNDESFSMVVCYALY